MLCIIVVFNNKLHYIYRIHLHIYIYIYIYIYIWANCIYINLTLFKGGIPLPVKNLRKLSSELYSDTPVTIFMVTCRKVRGITLQLARKSLSS